MLTIQTFLAVAEMIAAQLRIKEADRWTPAICQLKFVSFTAEFPEVTDRQFVWAAEQWLQRTGDSPFLRYPTWKQLMAPLYRTENGLANRSWGFKSDLPREVSPTPEQMEMLPPARSIALPPEDGNAAAYQQPSGLPPPRALPSHSPPGLTPEKWAAHLITLAEEVANAAADQQAGAEEDPGEGSNQRPLVSHAVQHDCQGACPAQCGIPGKASTVPGNALSGSGCVPQEPSP